jgi:type IV pilus assembly protein PilA
MLISGVSLVCSFLSFFGALNGPLLALVSLGALIFYLILLFMPGNPGDNRFGPPPPPNSGWVVAGAWSFIIVPFFGGILAAIAIPAYQDYIARSQTSEGIQLAGGAEVGVSEYYQQHKSWPDKLDGVYAVAGQDPAGRFVESVSGTGSGQTYGVTSTMKSAGVNRMIAGRSLEIWTTDGGASWHCGPGGADPVEPKFLPASCRDDNAP